MYKIISRNNRFDYKSRDAHVESNKLILLGTKVDQEKYFEDVVGDILDVLNCSVFYYPENRINRDEPFYERVFDHVICAVVIITHNLLRTENDIINIDINRYVKERNIPVLCIFTEDVSLEDYKRYFKNTPYLDRNENRTNSLPFKDKLKIFFNKIECSDKAYEAVENCFSKRIFLAYRKRDRHYVHQLMELIHSDPRLIDVGFYCQDYLTPGENYDETLDKMVRDCDAFIMLVSPSLINEDNSVKEYQYPYAMQTSKKIIGVNIHGINMTKFVQEFRYAKKPIPLENTDEIIGEILTALSYFDKSANNFTPEKNHLLGLAYLHGIDVEINHELALKFLKEAASYNFLPAINKLANMYEVGLGIPLSNAKMIETKRQSIGIYQKEFIKDYSSEVFMYLIGRLNGIYFDYKHLDLPQEAVKFYLDNVDWVLKHKARVRFDKDVSKEERKQYEYNINSIIKTTGEDFLNEYKHFSHKKEFIIHKFTRIFETIMDKNIPDEEEKDIAFLKDYAQGRIKQTSENHELAYNKYMDFQHEAVEKLQSIDLTVLSNDTYELCRRYYDVFKELYEGKLPSFHYDSFAKITRDYINVCRVNKKYKEAFDALNVIHPVYKELIQRDETNGAIKTDFAILLYNISLDYKNLHDYEHSVKYIKQASNMIMEAAPSDKEDKDLKLRITILKEAVDQFILTESYSPKLFDYSLFALEDIEKHRDIIFPKNENDENEEVEVSPLGVYLKETYLFIAHELALAYKAIKHFDDAINIKLKELDFTTGVKDTISRSYECGRLYMHKGDYRGALDHLLKALQLIDENNLKNGEKEVKDYLATLSQIKDAYKALNEFANTCSYLTLIIDKHYNMRMKGLYLAELGNEYYIKGRELEYSLDCFEKALNIFDKYRIADETVFKFRNLSLKRIDEINKILNRPLSEEEV